MQYPDEMTEEVMGELTLAKLREGWDLGIDGSSHVCRLISTIVRHEVDRDAFDFSRASREDVLRVVDALATRKRTDPHTCLNLWTLDAIVHDCIDLLGAPDADELAPTIIPECGARITEVAKRIRENRGIEKLTGAQEMHARIKGRLIEMCGGHEHLATEVIAWLYRGLKTTEDARDALASPRHALRFYEAIKGPFQHGPPKRGRNSPCFCGSGRKYKKCCLLRE